MNVQEENIYGFFALMSMVALYCIAPIAIYNTGGPIAWYMGMLVLTVILGILNQHLRFPRERGIDRLTLVFAAAPSVVMGTARQVCTVLVCFTASLYFTPWWQGVLFGWVAVCIGVQVYLLFRFFMWKKAKAA